MYIYPVPANAKKTQLGALPEQFERYCNVLPVFVFNSAKQNSILIEYYLLWILLKEWDIEFTVRKQANQFVFFEIVDIQLLDIKNFLRGVTSLGSFLKAYQTNETRRSLHYFVVPKYRKIEQQRITSVWLLF